MTLEKKQLKQRYYLHLMRAASLVVSDISQVLLIIANKRLTLAEKAIMAELQACAHWEGNLIVALAQLLKNQNYIFGSADSRMLRQINDRLRKELQGFIAAADHNLNYLEQYFEHDFWMTLSTNETAKCLSQIFGRVMH